MPEVLRLRNLGDTGINTDISQVDLPPEVFNYGMNFSLRNDTISTHFGQTLLGEAPEYFDPTKIHLYTSKTNNFYVICGSSAVYLFDGINWTNVSPDLLVFENIDYINRLSWSICSSGICIIINNPQIGPFYLYPEGDQFLPLPYDPVNTWQDLNRRCLFMRSHKNFLFAFGVFIHSSSIFTQEAGVNTYAWSTAADTNGLPYTWDVTDLAAIAGEASLAAAGGYIIDALSLRDAMCIYSRASIDILDYTGGEFVWQARQLTSGVGILATNCVIETTNNHVLLTDADIVVNDGNSVVSLLSRRLKTRISHAIDRTYYSRSFVTKNLINSEIWVCIPESGTEYPNIAFIYNYLENKIYMRELDLKPPDGCNGPKKSEILIWNNQPQSWEIDTHIWSDDLESPFDTTLAMIGSDPDFREGAEPPGGSRVYTVLENDTSDGILRTTVLERTDAQLSGYMEVTTVVAMYPLISCAGKVSIQMGASLIQGKTAWKPPVIFDPATMKKVDIRTTGAYHSWRFESVNNIPFTLSGFDVEYEFNGRR